MPGLLLLACTSWNRRAAVMTKYILLALVLMLIGGALWFWRQPGPQQLDLADRLYPLGTRFDGSVKRGIVYSGQSGQQLDIYQPPGNGPHPAVIFFHGGSWRDGSRAGYGFAGRAFAAQGFTTIIADYRKAPQHKFPDFVVDAASAANWTHRNVARYGGDANRIFLMGHSAGAHVAMLAALDPQWLTAQGSDSSIITGIIGISGPYDFLPFEKGGPADIAMGDWPQPDETQPITYARRGAPPVLLLTGDADTTVRPRNSINLHNAMKNAGAVSTIKKYAALNHIDPVMAISRPFRTKAPLIRDAVAFMQAVSAGREFTLREEAAQQ